MRQFGSRRPGDLLRARAKLTVRYSGYACNDTRNGDYELPTAPVIISHYFLRSQWNFNMDYEYVGTTLDYRAQSYRQQRVTLSGVSRTLRA
jgi:hypothetical protein